MAFKVRLRFSRIGNLGLGVAAEFMPCSKAGRRVSTRRHNNRIQLLFA